jgi:hypothetical protein
MKRRCDQKGQLLVMSALVMAFLFLPLSIFVIDTALAESAYAQLGETLQASAEDSPSTIDEAAYRSSNGKRWFSIRSRRRPRLTDRWV